MIMGIIANIIEKPFSIIHWINGVIVTASFIRDHLIPADAVGDFVTL